MKKYCVESCLNTLDMTARCTSFLAKKRNIDYKNQFAKTVSSTEGRADFMPEAKNAGANRDLIGSHAVV